MYEIPSLKEVSLNRIIETFYGKYYFTEEESRHINPAVIGMYFISQKDYVSGAGIRNGDLMIQFDPKNSKSYYRELFDYLITEDNRLITDRKPGFEVVRVILPDFKLLLDDYEIFIETLATFYEDGFFSLTYVYHIDNNIDSKMIKKILDFNVSHILMDTLLFNKLRFNSDELNNIDYKNIEYIGLDIKDFFSYTSKTGFMLEFLFSYFKEDKIKYIMYNQEFSYYRISSQKNFTQNKILDIHKIIQRRPSSFIFNKNVSELPIDVSNSNIHQMWLCSNYVLSLEKDLKIPSNNENVELHKFNTDVTIAQFFVTIEYLIVDKLRILDLIEDVKSYNFFDMSNKELLKINQKLVEVNFTKNTFNFLINKGYKLSDLVIKTIKIESLYYELNTQIKRIEKVIRLRELEQKEIELKESNKINNLRHRTNLILQTFTLLVAIPAITQFIDIIIAMFNINTKNNEDLIALIKFDFIFLLIIIITNIILKKKTNLVEQKVKWYQSSKKFTCIQIIILLVINFYVVTILLGFNYFYN